MWGTTPSTEQRKAITLLVLFILSEDLGGWQRHELLSEVRILGRGHSVIYDVYRNGKSERRLTPRTVTWPTRMRKEQSMLAKSCMPLSERRNASAFNLRVREKVFTGGKLASLVGRWI